MIGGAYSRHPKCLASEVWYLDQNQWISLLKDYHTPDQPQYIRNLSDAVTNGSIITPLSFTNIYETFKINSPERRRKLAAIQCALSKGIVFRNRQTLLRKEISNYFRKKFQISEQVVDEFWFLSEIFFDSAAPWTKVCADLKIPKKIIELTKENPMQALYTYLGTHNEPQRREAVQHFSSDSIDLIQRIEKRRNLSRDASKQIRSNAYKASMFLGIQEIMICILHEDLRINPNLKEYDNDVIFGVLDEVELLQSEHLLASRLENESRPIDENDLRDMMSYSTIIPYADVFIGEKAFTSRARQCGLDKRFNTYLHTDIKTAISEFTARKLKRGGPQLTFPTCEYA